MDENLYAAPEAEVMDQTVVNDPKLVDLNFMALKQLYRRSSNINSIVFFNVLGVLLWGYLIFIVKILEDARHGGLHFGIFIPVCLFILNLSCMIFIWRRTTVGRGLGIVWCVLVMTNIPIGTLIRALCLAALIKGGNLFGPDRVPHKLIKAEYKFRKKNKILRYNHDGTPVYR